MKLYVGFGDFKPWSGAIDTWEKIEEAGKIDELETCLDEIYPEGMSKTDLNDLLWMEPETVFEWLGISEEKDDNEFDFFCQHFSSCEFCPLKSEVSIVGCIKHFNGLEHDALIACIKGEERDKYDKLLLDY